MTPIFQCKDKRKKHHRLKYDGGSSGSYVVELCVKCRKLEDSEFLIEEKSI